MLPGNKNFPPLVFSVLSVFLVLLFLFLVFRLSSPNTGSHYKTTIVTIAQKPFSALISDTDTLREQGLSGRDGLRDDQAMLFMFAQPSRVGFWMKDMKFSIDILWLDSEYRVVSFEKKVSPETYPKVFFPTRASQYVVELSAGTLDQLSVSEGDRVTVSGGK